eukprot:NODE_11380_length_1290_cov_7.510748.p1 GENE.NODE_11380_length_1290_cov_7.510748~~NODE_11380_length_1290_cov_7.510748.p1  ORF type:complete len:375 (+),score=85.81 NODE_11380_length_1290_cov_7.510748:40-1125(+)
MGMASPNRLNGVWTGGHSAKLSDDKPPPIPCHAEGPDHLHSPEVARRRDGRDAANYEFDVVWSELEAARRLIFDARPAPGQDPQMLMGPVVSEQINKLRDCIQSMFLPLHALMRDREFKIRGHHDRIDQLEHEVSEQNQTIQRMRRECELGEERSRAKKVGELEVRVDALASAMRDQVMRLENLRLELCPVIRNVVLELPPVEPPPRSSGDLTPVGLGYSDSQRGETDYDGGGGESPYDESYKQSCRYLTSGMPSAWVPPPSSAGTPSNPISPGGNAAIYEKCSMLEESKRGRKGARGEPAVIGRKRSPSVDELYKFFGGVEAAAKSGERDGRRRRGKSRECVEVAEKVDEQENDRFRLDV